MSEARGNVSGRRDWILVTILAVSVVQNLVLGFAVLRFSVSGGAAPPVAAPIPQGPQVGALVPSLDVQRLGGAREEVRFGEDKRPTLLYIFAPKCSWCAKNADNLRAVLTAAKSSHRVVALSLDPQVGDYARTHGLDVPVYVNPSEKMFRSYGLGPTPVTLVVGADGKVTRSWVGAYSGDTKTEVEAYFGLQLPGLIAPPTKATTE